VLNTLLDLLRRVAASTAGKIAGTFLAPVVAAAWGVLKQLDPFVTATLALSALCLVLAGIVLWPMARRLKSRDFRRVIAEFVARHCQPASQYLQQAFNVDQSLTAFEGKLFHRALVFPFTQSGHELAKVLKTSASELEIAIAFDHLIEEYTSAVYLYHRVEEEKGYQPPKEEYARWKRAHRVLTRALREFVNTERYRCLRFTNGRIEILEKW
jgi:hypothetical protein